MTYKNIERAKFLSRPNRFIANVETERGAEVCHVKNTGRCRELLLPGAEIYVQRHDKSEKRKTELDLISVMSLGRLVNIDSQAPNIAAYEWIANGGLLGGEHTCLRREVTYKKSRIDLYAEIGARKCFIEVKGVTLFDGTTALFPDAPTERGVKHIKHLEDAVKAGFESYILFVVQASGLHEFTPNSATDPDFADALRSASENGVKVIAVDCVCTPDSMEINKEIDVRLR